MGHEMRNRLAVAAERAGVVDTEGVLAHDDMSLPLAGALRLAERSGLSVREFFG